MAEFGLPARNATSDANAGTVNPPAVRKFEGSGTSQSVKVESDVSAGVSNLGASLGNSLQGLLAAEANNINEQRKLDASIRQGSDKAVNAIDEGKKRVGWEKFVFGEDIEYRAAQQRAVTNNIQQMYIEQASTIDEFAADTGEEYSTRLKGALDVQLEQHADDPETKQLITNQWAASSEKLVHAQAKSHYGFKQMENRRLASEWVRGVFDVVNINANLVSTPDEAEELAGTAGRLANLEGFPVGMSDTAKRTVMDEEINHSLKNGNIGIYNMMKGAGWYKGKSTKELAATDKAIATYDKESNYRMVTSVNELDAQLQTVKTEEEFEQTMKDIEATLVEHEDRTSGTDLYKKNTSAMRKSVATIVDKAITNYAETATDAATADQLKLAQIQATNGNAAAINGINPTIKESKAAADSNLTDIVGNAIGQDNLTAEEATSAVLSDPKASTAFIQQWAQSDFDSTMGKALATSLVSGMTSPALRDENGQLNEQGVRSFNLINQMSSANRGRLRTELGAQDYDRFVVVQAATRNGKTLEQTEREVQLWDEGRDTTIQDWGLVKHESKQDHVTMLVNNKIAREPNSTELYQYIDSYNRGLRLGKGSHDFAKEYLYDSLQSSGSMYRGQMIYGAEQFEKDLNGYSLPQVMEAIQTPNFNIMQGVLAAGLGKTEDSQGDTAKSIGDLSSVDLTITVLDNTQGILIDHPKFQTPVSLPVEELIEITRAMKQNARVAEMHETARREAELKETEWLRSSLDNLKNL
jgi:hypothetical protein